MAVAKDNTRIQVTIPKKIKKQLEKKAEENHRSVSNYVASLIIEDLKDYSK